MLWFNHATLCWIMSIIHTMTMRYIHNIAVGLYNLVSTICLDVIFGYWWIDFQDLGHSTSRKTNQHADVLRPWHSALAWTVDVVIICSISTSFWMTWKQQSYIFRSMCDRPSTLKFSLYRFVIFTHIPIVLYAICRGLVYAPIWK